MIGDELVRAHFDVADGQATAGAPLDPFIDWGEFWRRDRTAPEWALEDILAWGRGHSIYAPHKAGKSLLALWCAVRLVERGCLTIYLDYEMGEEDLFERLGDMGYGPGRDLSLLRYALLPSLPPLDKAAGGAELLGIVDREMEAHPGRHVSVIIDTIGRATVGEENPADTIRDFYRHTGLGLKQRGATWARLDHAGKDATKGARGSSAKGDDVDVVWRLAPIEGGVELHRDAARMGWVPERVTLRLESDPVLRFVATTEGWPLGTLEVAAALDRLRVPLDASAQVALAELRKVNEGRRKAVVLAALRHRRQVADGPEPGREPPREPPQRGMAGTAQGTDDGNPHDQGPEPGAEPAGTGVSPGWGGFPLSRGEPPPGRSADGRRCSRCGKRSERTEPGEVVCRCDGATSTPHDPHPPMRAREQRP